MKLPSKIENKRISAAIAILLSVLAFMLSEHSRNWLQHIVLERQIQEQIQIGKNLDEQIKNSKATLRLLEELNGKESWCGN